MGVWGRAVAGSFVGGDGSGNGAEDRQLMGQQPRHSPRPLQPPEAYCEQRRRAEAGMPSAGEGGP